MTEAEAIENIALYGGNAVMSSVMEPQRLSITSQWAKRWNIRNDHRNAHAGRRIGGQRGY